MPSAHLVAPPRLLHFLALGVLVFTVPALAGDEAEQPPVTSVPADAANETDAPADDVERDVEADAEAVVEADVEPAKVDGADIESGDDEIGTNAPLDVERDVKEPATAEDVQEPAPTGDEGITSVGDAPLDQEEPLAADAPSDPSAAPEDDGPKESAEPSAGINAEEDVATYGPQPKFWGITMGLAAATKNIGVGFKLRYLAVLQTDFGTDYLLTSLVNGLSLDDLDAFRVTAAQTVGFKIRPWPFELDWRHSPRREGLIPEIILGGGGWAVAEMDHALQYFRLKDAGYFGGASVGGFATFAFADVSVTFLYRPVGITAYWIDGAADYTPFSLGNPILDVNVTYTLPL